MDEARGRPEDLRPVGSKEKELVWIEDTTRRFKDGYNWFGRNAEKVIGFLDKYMKQWPDLAKIVCRPFTLGPRYIATAKKVQIPPTVAFATSISDCIDTAEDTWEEDALNACSDNVGHNQRTSRRVKQKTMNRFKKYGATGNRAIAGYIVPEGARSYDDWLMDESLAPFILEGARLLRETLNGEAVARYFNENQVRVGPFARSPKWNGTMVLRFYRNTLLKGFPQRGKMATVKKHGTGKRVSRKNPKGPSYYEAPHLAILSVPEFDELNALLDERNKRYCRKRPAGLDPRLDVPRTCTRSFGQHARCWYCGRHYVWGANGITDNLMCSDAREWKCWNSVGFSGRLAAERLVEYLASVLWSLDGIEEQFRELVGNSQQSLAEAFTKEWQELELEETKLRLDRENAKAAVLKFGASEVVQEVLNDLDTRAKLVQAKRHRLESTVQHTLDVPCSMGELRTLMLREFKRLAVTSKEFAPLVRSLVPQMHVYLVRLCDGGHLYPRAKLRLDLLGRFPDGKLLPELEALLTTEVTLDLFQSPQRERIRCEAVLLAEKGYEQRRIASDLAEKPTQTAVFKALELQRQMEALMLDSPFVTVYAPPADYTKLRRHKNAKFSFEQLDGYVPPNI